jgi:hypothetical protein
VGDGKRLATLMGYAWLTLVWEFDRVKPKTLPMESRDEQKSTTGFRHEAEE